MNGQGAFSRGRQNRLVGRNSELELLRQLLVASEAGRNTALAGAKKASAIPLDTLRSPQCMVLMGETGIGKTRLAEEVSHEAEERGWLAIWSRNYVQESSIPYRPWVEILRTVMDVSLWQKQDLHAQPLLYARLATILPELYSQLPQTVSLPRQSPEQEQQSLWEAILELFKLICVQHPLLVVLDDIQWADASSGELLAYLARRSPGLPLVFLATCRETELAPKHPLRSLLAYMQREHSVKTLLLQPLTDTQISAMVAYLPASTVHYIQAQASGNPFFAEELARSLGTESSSDLRLKQPKARGKNSLLPATITAALHHRVSRLSRNCQQLLSNAAVLGGSFEFSLICSMEGSNAAAADEDAVLDLLDEALQAGMLTEEGRGVHVSYRFWHPLLVSHLYEKLSATKRALLHRRAAHILRQAYATREVEGAATITYHLVEGGGEPEQIIHYATVAGNRAYALSAYPEAERLYHIAVEHARAVQAATKLAQDGQLHLATLLERLGECIRIQGNAEEARQMYEQALHERAILKAGLPQAAHAAQEREVQIDALLWSEVGWTWYATNSFARARQYCERGEQVLRAAGVTGGPAWARLYFQQSYIFWQEGHYDEARRAGYEAMQLFAAHLRQPTSDDALHLTRLRRTLEGDPVDLARTHRLLSALALSVGQPTESLTHLNMAMGILEQHDHLRELAHVCCNMGHINLQKAEHQLAQNFLRRSLALAERIGDIPLTSVVFSNLGELAVHAGDLEEAENWYRRGLELAEQCNDHVYMSNWNVILASALQDQGKLLEAAVCLRRALSISRAMHNAPCIGFALVGLGNIRILQAMDAQEGQGSASHHFLARAKTTLQRALALPGLDAETKVPGQLALAQAAFMLGELETAQQQATQTLDEAARYEFMPWVARTQRLLCTILTAKQQFAEAELLFQQAIQFFSQTGMHLEYARTLYAYAVALLQSPASQNTTEKEHLQAHRSLQEARHIFLQCQAAFDLQKVERFLSPSPGDTAT